eukprot:2622769-Prymnesium_polylepis.1
MAWVERWVIAPAAVADRGRLLGHRHSLCWDTRSAVLTHDSWSCRRRAVRLLPTASAVAAVSFAKDECTHSRDRRHRAKPAFQQAPRSVMAARVLSQRVQALKLRFLRTRSHGGSGV